MEAETDSVPLDMLETSPFSQEWPAKPAVAAEATPVSTVIAGTVAPLTICGDGSFDRPVFGTSDMDPEATRHPFDGCCKVCSMMTPPRETRLEQAWRNCDQKAPDGRWLFRGYLPVNCCEACYEEAKKDSDVLDRQRDWWLAKCPVEFRDEWDNAKGDARLYSRVMQFDPKRGRGLVIHGPTDCGKTRAVWRLLRKLAEEGQEWLFVEAIDLLDNIPERAFSVPLLVIDDLGNDVLTAQKEVRLLKLLRTRTNWHRPVIITTQFTGDTLAKRFSETATAQAVIRRMRKFCDDISVKPLDGTR